MASSETVNLACWHRASHRRKLEATGEAFEEPKLCPLSCLFLPRSVRMLSLTFVRAEAHRTRVRLANSLSYDKRVLKHSVGSFCSKHHMSIIHISVSEQVKAESIGQTWSKHSSSKTTSSSCNPFCRVPVYSSIG